MKRFRAICLLAVVSAAACAFGQPAGPPPPDQPDNVPPAGLWPTPLMMERFIDRFIEDDLARTYGLDDEQIESTRALFQQRFPAWMKANRPQLMQLTNEYLETLAGAGPPDPQFVASWALRALPLVDGFADQVEAVGQDMSTYMTEQQRVILEGQLAAFRVGMNFMTQKLGSWADGKFDPNTDWIMYPEGRRQQLKKQKEMQAAMEAAKSDAMAAAQGDSPAQPATPAYAQSRPTSAPTTDDWTRYVNDFIRRYQLDADQQETAHKLLRSAQEQRERFLKRSADAGVTAQLELKNAKTPEQRAKAEQVLAKFKEPLDRIFTILKERLEPIPTRAQRQAAIERDQHTTPASSAPPRDAAQPGAKRESPSSP